MEHVKKITARYEDEQVLPEHKLDHQTVLVSDSDCVSDETTQAWF